jgi:hypothetical protein
VAANKSDMYEYEEVPEKEGIEFAKKHNAIFQSTTAKDANGSIDLLFTNIGKKFLNPDMENESIMSKEELQQRGEKLKQEKIQNEKKGGCC